MAQLSRSEIYQELKAAGVPFSKQYRDYTTEELAGAYNRLQAIRADERRKETEAPLLDAPAPDPEAAAFFGFEAPTPEPVISSEPLRPAVPVRQADPHELAGARLNTREEDEVIRIDPDTGREWYQEEVRKPATPKPRGRRVLRYKDPGVVVKTVKDGDYTETFEIAGDPMGAREQEVKITLPSYQVGIYKDPRFPFKTVCYNENEGFELEGVQEYYGGAELVPTDVLRKYVENVLCYDVRSVVAAINKEYRDLQLSGKIR